jgi:3-oxoacyl-(acyl-carrier-protein) synthase
MPRAIVTGMGVVSALGRDCHENLESLQKGESGIRKPVFLQSRFCSTHLFGEVRTSDSEFRERLGLSSEIGFSRTDLMALHAFEEAVTQAGLSQVELSSPDTAFISASTVGGMCLTDQLYADSNLLGEGSSFVKAYSFGAHTLSIALLKNIKGYSTTINTACSSSANSIMLGARLIKAGKIKRAIVGGTDALAKFTINGFNSLQILSAEPCKPFDEFRNGLSLGEAAAYLVLESDACCTGKDGLAEVLGYGNANDAHHPSALSDEAVGVVAAISGALRTSGVSPEQISYINAHGTATPNNDITELKGIRKCLGFIPPYSSTKSYTGHTLGAAGAVEAVFSIFSLLQNEIYPNLHCETPMKAYAERPERKLRRDIPVRFVLSNSFGFAGNCTSLILGNAS